MSGHLQAPAALLPGKNPGIRRMLTGWVHRDDLEFL